MITAMLLVIPNIAENQYLVNKRVISRSFKKLIEQYDAKAFQLAPENYRDNIVYAAKQLNKSNWKQALDHIFAIRLLSKMHEFQDETFKAALIARVKEIALKAFLCRSARTYDSFSLDSLSQLFELPQPYLL
jgi:adenylyl- and sulfurtransferase ThiI